MNKQTKTLVDHVKDRFPQVEMVYDSKPIPVNSWEFQKHRLMIAGDDRSRKDASSYLQQLAHSVALLKVL
jgi:hypothetical protein